MRKIALMCDSGADISKQEAAKWGIHVLRMPLVIDDQEYIESETISDEEIIRSLQNNCKIKTSQPALGSLLNMWDQLLETYDGVFYIPLSHALSGTCDNAIQLSKNYRGRVCVLHSELVCYPVVRVLQMAKEMFDKGYTMIQVKEKLETEASLLAILIPENLMTLKNGGRISPAAASLAGLLKIHPLLSVERGAIDVVDKVRTLKKAYAQGIQYVTQGVDPSEYEWMIIDADNRGVSDELKVMLEEATNQPVAQHEFKAVIMSHTGVGTIGFGRIKKIKY